MRFASITSSPSMVADATATSAPASASASAMLLPAGFAVPTTSAFFPVRSNPGFTSHSSSTGDLLRDESRGSDATREPAAVDDERFARDVARCIRAQEYG